ncbi:MAG TPA: tRNA (adenosine(37)-N6)-threonylcarbamoyltransferase complex dimerization subunit type 1 TsaB [Kofleriaceae bacterium]|nr:tRNA (adenosine(37)-N6)-threonylcarbamoyltransferase complex dimerization subunit type 1 TsaB [Kofleriaceae bacterium]
MRVLGIDTSTSVASCAVAVAGDGGIDVIASLDRGIASHSDDLLVIIDEVLKAAALTVTKLDAVCVGTGPGSFTGLRIGMATAKGLAFAAGVPLWTASSLAALAADARAVAPAATEIVALMDARRGEVFCGVFAIEGQRVVAKTPEDTRSPADLAGVVTAPLATVAVVGEGAARYPEAARAVGFLPPGARTGASGAAVVEIAWAGDRKDTLMTATPTYIRPADAERKFPNGNPGGTFSPAPS